MSNSLYLVILIALPVIGAVVLAAMSGAPVKTVKLIALAFTLAELAVVVALWIAYRSAMGTAAEQVEVPFREVFSVDWIASFGISFTLGVDGISLTMIALIAVLMPIVLGASWEEKLPAGRTIGGYFALLLVLQGAMIGVFAATNVFVFYVMFEVMLIPMYFLIGAFGGVRRAYAATKFFLYSLLGGLLMLASVIGLYVASGNVLPDGGTFDWVTLRSIASQIPESTQMWIFAGFAIAFAIKAPLVPLHTWLPDAGTEAPVGAGTLLVGVLDKVGTFGFLRICLPLLPAASAKLAWLIILLAVIGIVYGAIVAAGQTDLKRFVTYTSIAHFGFIALGVFAFTTQSIAGAALLHGQPRHRDRAAVPGGRHADHPRRLQADRRLRRGLEGGADPRRDVPDRLAGDHRDARHELVHLRVPGADRHLHPAPGVGGGRHHRHRAGRGLHAVDLPADDDRTGPRIRRAGRGAQAGDDPRRLRPGQRFRRRAGAGDGGRRRAVGGRMTRKAMRFPRLLRPPGTTVRCPLSGPSSVI